MSSSSSINSLVRGPSALNTTPKVSAGFALGSLLFFAGAIIFANKKKKAALEPACVKWVRLTFPNIHKIEKISGGFSNDLFRISTGDKCYILRSPKTKDSPAQFSRIVEISEYAHQCGIGPQVVAKNLQDQHLLLTTIDNASWPTYEENPKPYLLTMKALKCFHEKMKVKFVRGEYPSYTPFSLIFKEGEKLQHSLEIPKHFSFALTKIRGIYEKSIPWLSAHATLCHGDFHRGNVLLDKQMGLFPQLIDFDSAEVGHPFFDVVKISVALPPRARTEMFHEYLGREATPQEKAHFELIDLALLMVITCVRFRSAQNSPKDPSKTLGNKDLEELLNSRDPLPSFLQMPFGDTSPKARQLGATYALGEFLRRNHELALESIT
jgi:thiamine kinase-like enzyme